MRTTTIHDIPCWAATYLYYGDESGISEDDKALCDAFVKKLRERGYRLLEPVEDTVDGFNSCPAFGLACDTEDWVAEVLPKKKKVKNGQRTKTGAQAVDSR